MKIAILNDIHICHDNPIITEQQELFFKEVFFPYLEKEGITDIWVLGDVLEKRTSVNFESLNRARAMFVEPSTEYKLHILLGNHDVVHKNTNMVNGVNLLFGNYEHVRLYETTPEVVTVDGRKIAVVPWINKENEEDTIDFLNRTQAKVVFGHFDLIGFKMNKATVSEVGIDPKVFRRFDLVLSGHYHTKSFQGNVHQLGSQYEFDWNDFGDVKGFHVLDTSNLNLQFIENPNTLHTVLTYPDDAKIPDVRGKIVRVYVIEKQSQASLDAYVNQVKELGPAKISVIDDTINKAEGSVTETAKKTISQVMREYVDSTDIPEHMKKKVGSLFDNLYNDAMVS